MGHAAGEVPEGPAYAPRGSLIELPLKVAQERHSPKASLPGCSASLIVIGILLAIASRNVKEVAAPVRTVAEIAGWVAVAFSVSWGPFLLGLPWIVVGVLWWAGVATRTRRSTSWTVVGKDDGDDSSSGS